MKKALILTIACIFTFAFSSCSSQSADSPLEKEKFADCQRGFIDSLGNSITEAPEGYYAMLGHYLVYMDAAMESQTLVCSKPECLHNMEKTENVINCDAFFGGAKAIQYYDGYVYILAASLKIGESDSIYQVAMDGSSKKKIYVGQGEAQSFVIHRDNFLVYQKIYDPESPVPTITITKFPANDPAKAVTFFENSEYEDPEINDLICHGDYCYFDLVEFREDNIIISHGKRINMITGEATDFCGFANSIFRIGKDRVFCLDLEEYDFDNWSWNCIQYQCSLDGEKQKRLTEQDFSAIGNKAEMIKADDQYVYFKDIDFGANEVPKEKRKLYIYDYDGKLMAEIPAGDFAVGYTLLPGNEDFLLIKESRMDTNETVYYRIDKNELEKNPTPREILRVTDEFKVPFSY